MSPEVASTVHNAILAVGVVVWLLAFRAHRRAFRAIDLLNPDLLRVGELTVDAPPGRVRDEVVNALRASGLTGAGSIVLEEATDSRITGEATVYDRRRASGFKPMRFEIDLMRLDGATAATYRIHAAPGGGLKAVSALFVYVLGPAALIAAAVVMRLWVLPSDDPAVRTQSVQTIHVIHFLWEPFLFAFVRRRTVNAVENLLTSVLKNAAF